MSTTETHRTRGPRTIETLDLLPGDRVALGPDVVEVVEVTAAGGGHERVTFTDGVTVTTPAHYVWHYHGS